MERPVSIDSARYRPWSGRRRGRALLFWAIGRRGLGLVFRRKIFWLFLLIALFGFLFYSAVIYLQAQVEGRVHFRLPPNMREAFPFAGNGAAYGSFIFLQGTVVMVLLALAGGILVGNDFRSNALPFYLSKPI